MIDAADYYQHVRAAMLQARCRIMLIGWDFDTRIRLLRGRSRDAAPAVLADFVSWLADRRPELEIQILKWDMGAIKMLGRGSTLLTVAKWAFHDQIQFKLDSAHPAGASHHQKIVIVDDALAVCGGIDMTGDRWDTPEHLDDDPRRKRPGGKQYGPWHDATMIVDGDAARALGELGRQRWTAAGGEELQPCAVQHDLWPDGLRPTFRSVDVAIARTRAEHGGQEAVDEVEKLFCEMIRSARGFIYIENQYFASPKIADVMAETLARGNPPEIVLITPQSADGWLEQTAMDTARARLVAALQRADHRRRLRIYHPVTSRGEPIYVHAKLMIVDDRMIRVGSANLNNRSMGLDSECDLMIDAAANDTGDVAVSIERLRLQLLAEHLGASERQVASQLERNGSMISTIERLKGSGKTLIPYQSPELSAAAKKVADSEILDPERRDGDYEPIGARGLFKGRRLLSRPSAKRAVA